MADQPDNLEPEPIQETLDILNEEETEEKSEPESTEPADSDEAEEKEEEKEEIKLVEAEEPIEEKKEEELITPARRKEILKQYPDLFKKFPYLERAYYRDRQFTEIFPDIDTAKEVASKAETFDNLEQHLMSGSTTNVLKAVKQVDENAFNKIADNYLTSLLEVDQGAYYNVIGNVIKQTVVTMMNDGQRRGDEVLQEAARVLNQFVFQTGELQQPSRLSRPVNENQQLEQERQQFVQERFQTTLGDLESKVGNILKSTINQNIDPKSAMSDYVRKNASKDAYDELENLIDSDQQFRRNLDKLWERAFEQKFSKPTVDAIRSAYLSKAKTLLPRVIQKTRNEALRGMGKRVNSREEEQEESTPTQARMRSAPPSNSGKPARGKIPPGMSNKDYIMSD